MFRIVKAKCIEDFPVCGLRYFAKAGETITKVIRVAEGGSSMSFIHLSPNDDLISSVGELEDLDELRSTEPTSDYRIDFETLFLEMHLYSVPSTSLDVSRLKEFGDQEPIIVGGCGRSGTTLLHSIISSFPAVCGIPDETYAFSAAPYRVNVILAELEKGFNPLTHRRWCEKTPKNCVNLPEIFTAFDGKVKLVSIIRSPNATIASRHPNQHLLAPGGGQESWSTLKRWIYDNKAILDFPCHKVIRYEDLVSNTERTMDELRRYLGLEGEEWRRFHETTDVKYNVAYHSGKAKPIHTRSLTVKKRLPIDTLTDYEVSVLEKLMDEFGYEDPSP